MKNLKNYLEDTAVDLSYWTFSNYIVKLRFFVYLFLLTLLFIFCSSPLLAVPLSTMDQFNNSQPVISGPYLGIAVQDVEYEVEIPGSYHLDDSTLHLKYGYQFNSVLAGEFHFNFKSKAHTVIYDEIDNKYKDVYHEYWDSGIYLKVKYPSYIIPYALVGAQFFDSEAYDKTGGDEIQDFSFSRGVGVEFPMRGDYRTTLFAEVLFYSPPGHDENIYEMNDEELHKINVGLTYGF